MTKQCQCPEHAGSEAQTEWACTDCGSVAECGCQHRGMFTGTVKVAERNYLCPVQRGYLARRSGRA